MLVIEHCPRCNGTGKRLVVLSAASDAEPVLVRCDRCGGRGRVERVYWERRANDEH